MTDKRSTWLITGCSTGFGRALAKKLIARGDRVFATARETSTIADLVEGHDNASAIALDVTDADAVARVIATVERAGGADVLVNNAGYGYLTSIEEGEEQSYRAQFETNVFGLIAMVRGVLPGMRERGSGHIVNIASVGGLIGNPGSGYYAASKFAVVGLSESLSKEVGPLGIKVTVVEPGPFRTDWAGRSLQTSPRSIAAYSETVHSRLDYLDSISGKQPGDPERAADAIITAVESGNPPLNLVLGASGLRNARAKLVAMKHDLDAWEAISAGADFPAEPSPEA